MAKTKGKAQVDAIQLERLAIEYVPIDSIHPNEYNPNRQSDHEFELLLSSIEQDGMTQPVICTLENIIVDGEHRWRACKQLGYTEIPVVRVEMTEAQRRLSTLRHNLARGSHDIELEAGVLRDLEKLGALDWAQESLQLSDVELERMLTDMTPLEGIAGDEFGDSWDYQRSGSEDYVGGYKNISVSAAAKEALDKQRELKQQGLRHDDAELVTQTVTMTRAQHERIRETLGDNPADRLVAMAEAAPAPASPNGSKDEWVSMQFVVPATALPIVNEELQRIQRLAPTIEDGLSPEFKRGLALEFMAALSSQTPDESLM